jgi:hypothetical protein
MLVKQRSSTGASPLMSSVGNLRGWTAFGLLEYRMLIEQRSSTRASSGTSSLRAFDDSIVDRKAYLSTFGVAEYGLKLNELYPRQVYYACIDEAERQKVGPQQGQSQADATEEPAGDNDQAMGGVAPAVNELDSAEGQLQTLGGGDGIIIDSGKAGVDDTHADTARQAVAGGEDETTVSVSAVGSEGASVLASTTQASQIQSVEQAAVPVPGTASEGAPVPASTVPVQENASAQSRRPGPPITERK